MRQIAFIKKIVIFFDRLLAYPAAALIFLYQKTISPDHGLARGLYPYGYCRHYPSCSEYSKQSYLKFGFFFGTGLTLKRVASCNPLSEPKVDLVPNHL